MTSSTVLDKPVPMPDPVPAVVEPRSARLGGLDGLRALAVLAVILYHLGSGILPGGYIGVDVFFVISGYLITGLLVRDKDSSGRIRLAGFWMRRARRLLPALGLVVVVSASAALVIGGNPLVHLGRQVLGAATFSSNWLSIAAAQSYFDETSPELFRNLWSLAVEEQFYLVWPLVILLVLAVRSRRARVLIVLAIAAVSAVAMALLAGTGDPSRVYYGSDTTASGSRSVPLSRSCTGTGPRRPDHSHGACSPRSRRSRCSGSSPSRSCSRRMPRSPTAAASCWSQCSRCW